MHITLLKWKMQHWLDISGKKKSQEKIWEAVPLPLSVLKTIDQISDSIDQYSSAELFDLSAIV